MAARRSTEKWSFRGIERDSRLRFFYTVFHYGTPINPKNRTSPLEDGGGGGGGGGHCSRDESLALRSLSMT